MTWGFRRRWATAVAATAALSVLCGAAPAASAPEAYRAGTRLATAASPVNPVVLENRRAGSTGWQTPWPGMLLANDRVGQIEGYASATSVNVGDTIDLKVSTAQPTQTQWVVYRLGWYGGLGGRQVDQGTSLTAPGGDCPMDTDSGELVCAWPTMTTLTVPPTWISGVYVVVLTADGYQNSLTFTVRDDARSATVLDVQPVNTYQAYNAYPAGGGKSLYAYNSTGDVTAGGTVAAVRVSFDRPYSGAGVSRLLSDELPLIRYLEEQGQDVKYATDVDVDADPRLLASTTTTIFSGHDEYWSAAMYDAADAARDTGHSLSFFGANDVYWQMRYATNRRSVICWRDPTLDPVADPRLKTTLWRLVERPEQPLQGSMYPSNEGIVSGTAPWVVVDGKHWIYRGTGLGTGSAIADLVGGESNRRVAGVTPPTSADWTAISASPYVTSTGGPGRQEATLYRSPSNALVFTAGTLRWNPALGSEASADPRVQLMATNLLARQVGATLGATTQRAAGPTRYETAAALSAATFAAASHPIVFVATGENYPDALGASAASRGRGPILLVGARTVPLAVTAELQRLKPAGIVVVGGSDVVSDSVLQAIASSTGVTPSRLAGRDRYDTGALISSSTFAPGAPVAYLATGANFPDALAAGAAGAQLGGPVLLTGSTLPAAVVAELMRLKPQRIVVAGGRDVVSDAIMASLQSYAPIVVRRQGGDRFATALAVARDARAAWAGGRVVLATGMNFPDALAAGPAVAASGGTLVLLPRGSSLPVSAAEEVVRNDPRVVLAAGGSDTVPDSVLLSASALFAGLTPFGSATPGSAPDPLPAPKGFLVPSLPERELFTP